MNNITYTKYANFNAINTVNFQNHHIKCICLNIRSLRKNFNTFCAEIDRVIDTVDIIVLPETNIVSDEQGLFKINGFNLEFVNRDLRKGGGVAVYIKYHMSYQRVSSVNVSYESIEIIIALNDSNNLTLHAIYRTPQLSISSFVSQLENAMRKTDKDECMIMLGDININILDADNSYADQYLDMLSSLGFQRVISDCTRVDLKKNTATCIDHIFVKSRNADITAAVVETNISVHYSLICGIAFSGHHSNKENKDLAHVLNSQKVAEEMCKIHWTNIQNLTNVDEMYEKILSNFKHIYENSLNSPETNITEKSSQTAIMTLGKLGR